MKIKDYVRLQNRIKSLFNNLRNEIKEEIQELNIRITTQNISYFLLHLNYLNFQLLKVR